MQQHGKLADVQGVADGAGDGFKERLGFGKAAHLVGELVEDDLGVVGFAEELAIEPLLQAFADAKAQGQDERKEDDRADDVGGARLLFVQKGQQQAEADGCDESDLDHPKGGFGESIAGADAQQHADIERPLHDDDVGEGERGQHEDKSADGANPVPGGIGAGDAVWGWQVGQEHEDEEQRAHADAHAGGEDAEAAASILGGGGTQLIQSEDEVEDNTEQVERIDDSAGDVAGASEKWAVAAAVVLHVDGGIEEEDGDCVKAEENPLDPAGTGIDTGAFGKIDAKEEKNRRAGQLQRLVPEVAQEQRDATGQTGIDEDDTGEGEEDEEEPGVTIGGAGENDPVADEETDQGEQAGEQKALPEGKDGGHAAVEIIRPRQGDGCRRGRAVGEGDVDLEDVTWMAFG